MSGKKNKIKELKKVQRDNQLDNIRQFGDIAKLPKNKIFKDKKKEKNKYGQRGHWKPGDEE